MVKMCAVYSHFMHLLSIAYSFGSSLLHCWTESDEIPLLCIGIRVLLDYIFQPKSACICMCV
jgi:hypothetical protein